MLILYIYVRRINKYDSHTHKHTQNKCKIYSVYSLYICMICSDIYLSNVVYLFFIFFILAYIFIVLWCNLCVAGIIISWCINSSYAIMRACDVILTNSSIIFI